MLRIIKVCCCCCCGFVVVVVVGKELFDAEDYKGLLLLLLWV